MGRWVFYNFLLSVYWVLGLSLVVLLFRDKVYRYLFEDFFGF